MASITFRPDGNLYVINAHADSVAIFDGRTGVFIGDFVPASNGHTVTPFDLAFGPDGNLYVSDLGAGVLRFNGQTGDFMDVFVPPNLAGYDESLTFGPDGNLYVGDSWAAGFYNPYSNSILTYSNSILKFDGNTGAFLGVFASGNNLWSPVSPRFGPDGNLYVASNNYGGGGIQGVFQFNGMTGAFMNAFTGGLGNLYTGWAGLYGMCFMPALDTTSPTTTAALAGPAGNNGWYTGAVQVTLAATDPDDAASAITTYYALDGGSAQPYSGSVTVSGDGNHTLTFWSVDHAGNTEAQKTLPIPIDATPPVITITAPANQVYLLHQSVTVAYSLQDALSGLDAASLAATALNGTPLDTASVGNAGFSVSVADRAGNSASQTVSYTVGYGVNPLYDQTTAHKSGSTVPIKLQLVDADGGNVSSSAVVVHATATTQISGTPTGLLDDSGAANPDYDFRYDATLSGYIFNLSLKGYAPGIYVLHFHAGNDPTDHSVQFQVR